MGVPGLLAASEAAAPGPLDSKTYLDLLRPAWDALVNSEESRCEAVMQNFLERHPCLLPGAFSVDGESGHGPWPYAVISQPKLPDFSTKRPDFMWLATDSDSTYAIFIEIETPHARWFHQDGTEIHGNLSHAQGQLAEWRAWFNQPRNQIAFADHYELPGFLRRRTLLPRYVLIHGRREEIGEDRARLTKRRELYRADERLMTFDRLAPSEKAAELLCVKRRNDAYHLEYAPPSFRVGDYDDRHDAIANWQQGLEQSPDLSRQRAESIQNEIEDLRKKYQDRAHS